MSTVLEIILTACQGNVKAQVFAVT